MIDLEIRKWNGTSFRKLDGAELSPERGLVRISFEGPEPQPGDVAVFISYGKVWTSELSTFVYHDAETPNSGVQTWICHEIKQVPKKRPEPQEPIPDIRDLKDDLEHLQDEMDHLTEKVSRIEEAAK